MSGDILKSINGSLGEMSLEFTLYSLRNEGAIFLNNLYIPKTNGSTTEIDLVMLYKGEVYVFESKNFSGWIFGNTKSKYWTQSLKGRKGSSRKTKFYNPIMQNEGHIKYLKRIIGEEVKINSIVVFSDRCEFMNVDTTGCATYVTKRRNVLELVRAIGEGKSDSFEMTRIYNKLHQYANVSADVKKKHIDEVKKINSDNKKQANQNENIQKTSNGIDFDLGAVNDTEFYSIPLQYLPRVDEQPEKRKIRKNITPIIAIAIYVIIVIILASILGCLIFI